MPVQSTDRDEDEISYTLDNESWIIESGVSVSVSGNDTAAVYSTYLNSYLLNRGNLLAQGWGVLFGGTGSQIVNAADGYIVAEVGVAIYGELSELENYGVISGETAVVVTGDSALVLNVGQIDGGFDGIETAFNTLIENRGALSGFVNAVSVKGAQTSIRNSGEIQGHIVVSDTGTLSSLVNTGEIVGDIRLGDQSERALVTNSGLIVGTVSLGDILSDTFDGRGGSVVGAVSGGGGADTLTGGAAEDVFSGDDGADSLTGAAGDDTLDGGGGGDRIRGGRGADVFVYAAVADSKSGAMDVIRGWDADDQFDLSAIDASRSGGFQRLVFGGQIAAGDPLQPGRVHYYQQGGDTYVVADVNGEAGADLMIKLIGAQTLNGADFILS